MERSGLETPAPVEFLGGPEGMPAGGTGYFSVDLKPGQYVLIAEVPSPSAKGMMKRSSVPATDDVEG